MVLFKFMFAGALSFKATTFLFQMRKLSFLLLVLVPLLCSSKEEGSSKKDEVGTVIGIDLGTTYSW